MAVQNLAGAIAISAGHRTTCALLSGGAVSCWGYNSTGQLGNGSTVSSAVPVTVRDIKATQVALAGAHVCVLIADGSVRCWGYNGNGELGSRDAPPNPSLTPVTVTGW